MAAAFSHVKAARVKKVSARAYDIVLRLRSIPPLLWRLRTRTTRRTPVRRREWVCSSPSWRWFTVSSPPPWAWSACAWVCTTASPSDSSSSPSGTSCWCLPRAGEFGSRICLGENTRRWSSTAWAPPSPTSPSTPRSSRCVSSLVLTLHLNVVREGV